MIRITTLTFFCYILSFISTGCSSEENLTCFTFDEKQCAVDPWANIDLMAPRSTTVRAYFTSLNVELIDLTINVSSEATCLACEVCPSGMSFTITIAKDDASIVQAQDLLNLEEHNCQ